MCIFVVVIVPADGLAPLGARPSAGTVMAKFQLCICDKSLAEPVMTNTKVYRSPLLSVLISLYNRLFHQLKWRSFKALYYSHRSPVRWIHTAHGFSIQDLNIVGKYSIEIISSCSRRTSDLGLKISHVPFFAWTTRWLLSIRFHGNWRKFSMLIVGPDKMLPCLVRSGHCFNMVFIWKYTQHTLIGHCEVILYRQPHGWWWPGDARSQGMS